MKMLFRPFIWLFVLGGGCLFSPFSVQAQFTTLHIFGDGSVSNDGSNPAGILTQGTGGNFYGTTSYGGSTAGGQFQGYGTVLMLTPQGNVTILNSFSDGKAGNAGRYPAAGLVQGSDGSFYGTTSNGGSTIAVLSDGYGTFFKMTPQGDVTVLHNFGDGSVIHDGLYPGQLTQGSDGNFYGVTISNVFKITPQGNVTVLHSFGDGSVTSDGSEPNCLIQGSDGIFYGTTSAGGLYGAGTFFKVTSNGNFTILHSFGGGSVINEGKVPLGSVIQASDGNFYGTTQLGGHSNLGSVFKITPQGDVTILHSFGDGTVTNDGRHPSEGLIHGSDGNFYGLTDESAESGKGIVFRITPQGGITILDSVPPGGTFMQGSDGNFYGTTAYGGLNDKGTIFRLTGSSAPSPTPTGTYSHDFSGAVLPLWDVSGDYTTGLGQDIQSSLHISEDSFGKIHGGGTIDVTGTDMTVSANITATGMVKSSGSNSLVSLSMVATSGSGSAILSGTTSVNVLFTGTIKLNGAIYKGKEIMVTNGSAIFKLADPITRKKKTKTVKITTGSYPVVLDLPKDVTGDWNLSLDNLTLTKNKYTGVATVTTSTSGTTSLTATGSYSSKTKNSTLALKGFKGTGGSLNMILTLSGSNGMVVDRLTGKVYGQSLNYKP